MFRLLDRHWLLTSTNYGTWLPGDARGFVSPVREPDGSLRIHNQIGAAYTTDHPLLAKTARENLRGPKILFSQAHAEMVLAQFRETCGFRGWLLVSATIMHNHFHVVVSTPGDPEPDTLLRDLKSYSSRALNARWGKPTSETWWTQSGSRQKLPDEHSVRAATMYVRNQHGCLATFTDPQAVAWWRFDV